MKVPQLLLSESFCLHRVLLSILPITYLTCCRTLDMGPRVRALLLMRCRMLPATTRLKANITSRTVISAKSARGLSLSAYVLETLAYAITLAYSYRNDFPFSTYGENFFLTIQNVIITFLIIHYPTSRLTRTESSGSKLALATVLTAVAGVALYVLPPATLSALQVATIPLSLFSKLPQIRQNYRARSTGQLSAFAVISQIAGCLARLFTTSAEVGDPILFAGFALALVLNLVLGVQMWAYWGKDGREAHIPVPSRGEESEKERAPAVSWQSSEKVEVVIQPASPVTPSGIRQQPGRKWARKLD